ncbi:MAG: glycosyltransferase [Paludibacteraceae bacterium]|nr:glycosyltransferase [Paludibacteraceae bacterium]
MKLSIITVTYNNCEGLLKTLQSVANQTYKEFEQIIIDGGSKDNSINVIRSYEDKLPYCKWVSEPDKGIYDAMNKGIDMAEGEYCLFLNAGDALYGDSAIEELMYNNPNADIVSCNSIYEKSQYHPERYIISPKEIKASDLILNYLPHQATLIRRSLFLSIHNYDTSFKIVSDWLFFIEALLVYNASYEHIQMFLSCCESEGISNNPKNNELMGEEFYRGLKKVLPLYYKDYLELKGGRIVKSSEKGIFTDKLMCSFFGKIIWKFRNITRKLGYYRLKDKIKNQKLYNHLRREDKKLKKDIDRKINNLPNDLLGKNNDATDVIVSLTSYGERVLSSVPYAIYSIFNQTKLPNRIVLWLDNEHWNDDNIPKALKRLKQSGLEIYYCDDIRSYKKLIPSLKMFPDNPIIVIDDDFYYNKNFVNWMVEAYENSDKKTVFATWGCIPQKINGKYIPYSQWKDCRFGNKNSEISLFGGGSIYPPNIFDSEITREDLFMKLCPTADDIWFWAQEKRLGITTKLTDYNGYGLHRPVNMIDTYNINSDSLFYENCIMGANDTQLENVLSYYNLCESVVEN